VIFFIETKLQITEPEIKDKKTIPDIEMVPDAIFNELIDM